MKGKILGGVGRVGGSDVGLGKFGFGLEPRGRLG